METYMVHFEALTFPESIGFVAENDTKAIERAKEILKQNNYFAPDIFYIAKVTLSDSGERVYTRIFPK